MVEEEARDRTVSTCAMVDEQQSRASYFGTPKFYWVGR